jgi:hypothetical protein
LFNFFVAVIGDAATFPNPVSETSEVFSEVSEEFSEPSESSRRVKKSQ